MKIITLNALMPKSKRNAGGPTPSNTGGAFVSVAKPCLSDCSDNYLRVVADPFRPAKACIPIPPCMPSESLSAFSRGEITTGTTQPGYVMFNPWHMIVNDQVSGLEPVIASGSSFTGTTFSDSIVASTVIGYQSNSPWTVSQLIDPDKFQYRLVAAGLRVMYTGTKFDSGGVLYGFRTPANSSVADEAFTDWLKHDQGSVIQGGQNGWQQITFIPTHPDHFTYQNTNMTWNNYCMAFHFWPAAGKSANYQFEAWAHFEVIGSNARYKELRFADPIGGQAVMSALENHNEVASKASKHGYYDSMRNFTVKALSHYSSPMGAVAHALLPESTVKAVAYKGPPSSTWNRLAKAAEKLFLGTAGNYGTPPVRQVSPAILGSHSEL